MAIDTRAKRQSAAHVGFVVGLALLPTGTIDATARAIIAWTYGGITISGPPTTFSQYKPDGTVTIPQLMGKIIVNMPCAYITTVDQPNSYVDVDEIQQTAHVEGRL